MIIKGKEFTPAPEGTAAAVCVDVVDLGMVATDFGTKHKIRLVWELEHLMKTGKRFIAMKSYTASTAPMSTLFKDLKSWRGKPFSAEEVRAFDTECLIGVPCQLVIQHNESDGNVYANIVTIIKADPNKKLKPTGDYIRMKDRPDYKGPEVPAPVEEVEDVPVTTVADEDIPF